jgi:site-specific DNA-cytosine methylase
MPPSGWDENGNWTGKRSSGFGGLARSSASQAVPKAPSLIESRGANSLHGFDKEVLREPGESNRDFGRRLAVLQHTPKTANDYWGEFEWSDLVPYWSSGADVVEMKGLYDAVSRIDEGAGTPDDEKQVLSWLLDMNRPTTFGYKVADIGVGSIPFMGEMALSGGVSSLVKSGGMKVLRTGLEKAAAELGERAIGKVAGKMAKKVATKQLDDVLARGAGEVAERGALSALGRGVLRTAEITATSEMLSSMVGEGGRIEANTYRRALPEMGLAGDPEDASRLLVAMDGGIESFADALPEGAVEALFETGSEMMGGALTKYSGLDRLRGFQLKILSDLKGTGKWSRRMQKGLEAGQWHGIVGEWLEERANAAMQAATPGMFEEAGWLDVIPSIEQGLAEIVAFGATGGAMHGGGRALDKMLEPATVEQRGEGFLGGRPQGAAPETQQKPLTQPEQVANKLGRAVSDMETQNGVRYQPVAAEEDPRVGSLERALARVGVDLVVVAPSAEAGAAEADAGSDASERRVPVPAMWAAEGVVVLDSSVLDSPGATEALIAHEVEVHNNLEQARTRGEDALAPLLDVLEAASPGLLAEYRAEYARRYESSEQAQRGAEMATAAEAREAAEELIDAGDQHGGVALWGGYVRSQGARTDGDVQILDLMPSQKIIDAQRSERPALAEDALSEEAVATVAEQGFLRNLRAVLRTAKGQKLARQLYAGNRTKLQQLVDAIKGVVRRLGITLETREAAALRKLEQLLVAKIPANVDSREAVEAARALEQFVGIAEQRRTAEQATPPTARGQQAESQPATSEVATPLVAPAPPEQAPEPEMASLPQAVAPQAVEAQENAPASAGGVAEMPRTAPNMFGETEERTLERPEVAEEATQTGQLFQDDTGARGQTSILDTQESVPTRAVQPEAQAMQPESEEPAPAKTREPKKPLTPQQKKVNRRIAGRKAFKARVARYAAAEEGVRFVQWLRAKGGVNLSQGDLSDYTDPAYAHYNDGGVGLPRAVHKHGMTVDRLWEEIRDAGWFASIGRHDLQPGYSTGETYNESESRAADVAVLMQLLDENPTKRESEEWIEEAEEAYNQAQYDQYDAQFYDALSDVAEANSYPEALHEGLGKAYKEGRISYDQMAALFGGGGMTAEAAQALLEEANAKPRFALAPRTDSPEFRRWFGDSKVVDSEGKPLVVYHGTSSPWTVADFGKLGTSTKSKFSKLGFFFTRSPQSADTYAAFSAGFEEQGQSVMPVYLAIKNPKAITYEDLEGLDGAADAFNFRLEAVMAGHDGFVVMAGKRIAEYVAISPTQIKSAIGNRGTYDPADPDLRRAVAAHHGGPHEFDSFSTDKINTGEGNQAYGWGLYFASRKRIAEYYRRKLSGGRSMAQLDGKDISRDSRPEEIPIYAWGALWGGNIDDAIADLRADMESYAEEGREVLHNLMWDSPAKLAQDYADNIRWLEENRDRINYRPAGAGYTVELAPEDDEYLLWDRDLEEQSEKVQEALGWNQSARDFSDEMKRIFRDYLGSGDPARIAEGNRLIEEAKRRPRHPLTDYIGSLRWAYGGYAYLELSRIKGSPKEASLYLLSQGVRGIKYLDRNSRSKGEGSYNYVIFDDADVQVTGRWAIAEPASGGVAPRVATAFSGMGTVEAALGAESVLAVELDAAVVEAHNQAHGSKWKPEDVLALNPARIAAEDPDLFHASPVCKNCSTAKRGATIDKGDLAAGRKIAQVIREARPRAVTVENVPAYRHTVPYRLIVKALEEEGYFWDADLYNAAEYGGAQSRRRLIVRARRDRPLPPMPAKRPAADWYDLIKDLLPDAKLSRLPKWERQRIASMAEQGLLDLNAPILTMGGSAYSGRASAVNAGRPAPTLVSSKKSVPRILMPGGKALRVSGRMMARLMGLPDSMRIPANDRLAKQVLGNGIHGVISRDVIGPVADIKGQSRFAVTAHHGSPHNFDRFSTAKIGTGEGAQAYGWGLYFASRKEVAEHYKQSLSGPYRSGGNVAMDGWMYFLDGELQNEEAVKIDLLGDIFAYNNDRGALRDRLVHMRDWHLSERDRILDGGSRNGPYDAQGHDFKSTQYAGDIRRLDALPPGVVTRQKPGAGYTVELAPEEDEYLLWDEPLSKQSEKVRGALVQVERYGSLFSEEAARDDDNAMAGSNAYRTLSRGLLASGVAGEFGNPDQAASQALHAAGIRGIKYLDGTSRSKGEGSFNYVIFDDADVEITGRFALGDLNRPQDPQNQGYFPYVSDSLERAEEMTDKEALTSGLNALNSPPERKKQKSFSYLEEALQRATTPSGENVRAADPSTQIDIDPDNLPVLGDRVHLEEVFKAWLGNRQVAEEWAKSQAARRERELIRIVDELAPRDFKDILRESASAEPNRVAVREMDEAMHLWIDLGDRAEEQFAKWGGRLNERQRRVYELSQNLPPAVQELAEDIRAENLARGRLLKDAGVIESIVEGYSARIWDADADGTLRPYGLGRFKLQTDRAKQREFESTLHGWAKGRELRVRGAIGAQLAARLETAQVLHDRNLLETAKRYRVLSSKQHEGWERVEHPNFRPWKTIGKMPVADWDSMSPEEREQQFATYGGDLMITEEGEVLARQDAYAPAELARALNNALGKSRLMDIGWTRTLTRAQAKLKATILYTSLFHHQAYLRSYGLATEAFDNDLKNLNPAEAMRRGREAIERFGPEVQDLVRAGLTIGSTRDLEEDLLEEQTTIGRVLDKVPGAAEFSHVLEAMRRQQTNYLFHRMGPQLKMQAALLDYRHRLHVNRAELEAGTITRREIAEAVAEKVNNDFGGLNLQRLKINPTNWHIARLFLLAPDWTYSNVRSMVQVLRRGEVGRVHRALWSAVAVRGLVATIGFNLMMAAMPTDDDKDKRFTRRFLGRYQRAWEEGHLRWLDADVTPLYELFANGEGKRKYFSLIGHFRDPVKFLGNPVRSLKHKASPGASAVYEALSGTDWAGRPFTTTPELLGMDDKGVYASSRKGKDGKYAYRKGDPKGGKLAGQTVSWNSESRGPINFTNLPSFTIARTKAALPVQVQNLLAFVAGEQDAFDTITKSVGFMTSTTRPKEEDK